MYTLLVLAALAQQPVPAQPLPGQPDKPAETASGMAPEQVLATIDAKGKLTIVHVQCNCYGVPSQETTVDVPGKNPDDKPTKVKVKMSSVTMTTYELPAKVVEAYTAGGERIEAEKLAKLLAKERTVLLAMDGKKVDPFHLQLYKDDTVVLVPPANTLNMGGAIGAYGPGVVPVPDIAPPPPVDKAPIEKLEKQAIEREKQAIEREKLEELKKLQKVEEEKQKKNP
jgi:hypothetical protein